MAPDGIYLLEEARVFDITGRVVGSGIGYVPLPAGGIYFVKGRGRTFRVIMAK